MKSKDTYKEVKTLHYSNMTVRVHIPELASEERAKRMTKIHNAAANLLIGVKNGI